MKRRPAIVVLAFACAIAALSAWADAPSPPPRSLFFVGNSITRHGPAPKIGWEGNWGMAASAEDKDYVHLVVKAVTGASNGATPEFKVINVAAYERGDEAFDLQTKLKDESGWKADAVIVAIGENVPPLKTEQDEVQFRERLDVLLALLKENHPGRLYVRSCFWADASKDTILKAACEAAGGHYIDISPLSREEANYARSERAFSHDGVARHPGDKGMQAIADAIAGALLAR